MIRRNDQVPANVLADLIEQSELYDTVLVPIFPGGNGRNYPGKLANKMPMALVTTSYIDPDLFRHGLAELVADEDY